MAMQKTLTPIGNSLGILIEKPVLELLGITRDTLLKVTTDGEALIIRPVKQARADQLARIVDGVMDRHTDTLQKLAQ